MLYQKLNKESNYTIEPVPENYPIRGSLDITKAKKHLQYNPIYSLDEGLDDTINKY